MTAVQEYSVEFLEKQLGNLHLKYKPKLMLMPCPLYNHYVYQNKCSYCRDYVGAEISHEGEPDIDVDLVDKKTCAYCGNTFESRNKLFSHLRCMGVDTTPTRRNSRRATEEEVQQMQVDCGTKRRRVVAMDLDENLENKKQRQMPFYKYNVMSNTSNRFDSFPSLPLHV